MNEYGDVQAPPKAKSSWFGRNWIWVLPLGCVTTLLALVAFVAGLIALLFGAMTRSDVYQHALEAARSSPAVIEALGEPIESGWYLTGNIHVSGSSGEADIAIPISGPEGKGTVYAVATKSAGEWEYERLEVELGEGGERIDLRSESQ